MPTRPHIRLKRSDEIQVNGYIIRAVGDIDHPAQLSVYHSNAVGIIEQRHDPLKALYAGQADTVVCGSVLVVGTIGDLVASDGWPGAIQTAKDWLANHIRFFNSSDALLRRAEEAAK